MREKERGHLADAPAPSSVSTLRKRYSVHARCGARSQPRERLPELAVSSARLGAAQSFSSREAALLSSLSRRRDDRIGVALLAFGLDPAFLAPGSVRRVCTLRDNSFQAHAAGVLVNRRAVALQRFDIDERRLRPRKQLLKTTLALDKRQLPQVLTIEPEEVEGVVGELVGFRLAELAPQRLEIRPTGLAEHDRLAVEDRILRLEPPNRLRDRRELLCPVEPVSRKDLRPTGLQVDLCAVAVPLDLMQPFRARGRHVAERRVAELEESREGARGLAHASGASWTAL